MCKSHILLIEELLRLRDPDTSTRVHMYGRLEFALHGGTSMTEKKAYVTPTLVNLGSVADLTKTGTTNAGADAKTGSVGSRGV